MRRVCTHCYREVYELCQPGFRGRCTAPLVVDRHQRRLVSNESSDIVRMLNSFQVRRVACFGVSTFSCQVLPMPWTTFQLHVNSLILTHEAIICWLVPVGSNQRPLFVLPHACEAR